jgi:hypothetical protein
VPAWCQRVVNSVSGKEMLSSKSKDRGRWPGTNFQEYFPDGICRHQFLGPEIIRKNAMYTKTIYESIDNINRRYFRLSLNLQAYPPCYKRETRNHRS